LGWVESQLGLSGPPVAWTDRVLAYHQALSDHPGAVYSASFQADPWATASHLLRLRDALLLAAWDPATPTSVDIVDALAELEPLYDLPGIPDRLHTVLSAINAGLLLPDHEVTLQEPTEEWPPLWQRVLTRLNIQAVPVPEPRGHSGLASIQNNLLLDLDEEVSIDSSIEALQAGSRHAAVAFVTRVLRDRHAIVFTPDIDLASMLDTALHADGQPTAGAPRDTRGQPVHQVLPLVIELLWEPVNPYVLLDLLLLPVGPLRRYSYRLARALEKQPGFGSDAWNDVIDDILADDADGEHGRRLGKWFDHERIAIGQDVQTNLVEERCSLIVQWALGRAHYEQGQEDPDEGLIASLQSAATQARALGTLAAQLGASISESQLRRLLEDVRNEASIDIGSSGFSVGGRA